LFVAYYASAEFSCHLALGWPLPERVLDLFAEFRALTNGKDPPAGDGLLGALAYFGLDAMAGAEKEGMRLLAMRGGPYTPEEQAALLAYCEKDVIALEKLLPAMLPFLKLPYALNRGRYMKAVAHMERRGVPIDAETFSNLRDSWSRVQQRLVARIDEGFGVYEGTTFKQDRFESWLLARRIAWPRHRSGSLKLDDETFKAIAQLNPSIAPLRQLRKTLSQMRTIRLQVGPDSRNRAMLSAFAASSGRNAPSTTKFIFGAASWIRSLIQPSCGYALAYIDWSQQEFGIAAALSGDPAMMAAYDSGDPYLAFAKQAHLAPPDATKATHGLLRELCKSCVLGVNYGMEADTLALRTGLSVPSARELLRAHRHTYPRFWRWSEAAVDLANLSGRLYTVFDWGTSIGRRVNPRSLRNFPMQANGAEMLRLACCLLTEEGIAVCAPVHDAVLIEAPGDGLDNVVARAQAVMAEASAVVLDGFRLRSEAKLIRYPDRFMDERGQAMWELVQGLLADQQPGNGCAPAHPSGVHPCNTDAAQMPTRPI
jgi:hypothetical protein